MRQFWSKEEIEHLRHLYEDCGLSLVELCDIFNEKYHRTKESIAVKIGRYKFRHTKEQTAELKSRLNLGNKNGMYGKPGARKGFTKFNDEVTRLAAEKMSITKKQMFKDGLIERMIGEKNPMFGKEGWNKGQTKYTNKILFEASQKMSKAKKEQWKNLSQDEKDIRIGNLSEYANMAKKDTWIELAIKGFLDKEKIAYIKNHRMSKFIIDFYLTDFGIAIECQGDYWHANPVFYNEQNYSETQKANIERDGRKKQFFKDKKINNLFFWEYDIKHNRIFVEKQIIDCCGKK